MTLRKSEGFFLSAWHHLEYAMNQSAEYFDDELRRKYIGDAAYLLGQVIDTFNGSGSRRINPSLYTQALVVNTYLPVFTKRALGRSISPADCSDIYLSLGRVFRDINSLAYPDASFKSARFAEMVGPALSARTLRPDALLYPASPREEASAQQTLNHDGYFIKAGHKMPLQTKLIETGKAYDDPTQTIYIEPLAEHALARAGMLPDGIRLPLGVHTGMIAELISEDAEGVIDRQGKAALDFLTRSVMARFAFVRPIAA